MDCKLDEELMKAILAVERSELTEHMIYLSLLRILIIGKFYPVYLWKNWSIIASGEVLHVRM